MQTNKSPSLMDVRRMEQAKPADARGKNLVIDGVTTKEIKAADVVADIMSGVTWGEAFVMEALKHYSGLIIAANLPPMDRADLPADVPTPQEWTEAANTVATRLTTFLGV